MQTQRSIHISKKRKKRRKGINVGHQSSNDISQIHHLYRSQQSYPVIEYLPSDEELESSILTLTPSFVLEVTWPRIVQFYHPNSPRCRSFQPTFVHVARGIKKRSSRLPIEFYAVNCGVYRELCEMGFYVSDVPTMIGFKSGEIERTAMFLPGSVDGLAESTKEFINDVEVKMEYIALTMDIQLDPVKGANSIAAIATPKGLDNYYVSELESANNQQTTSLVKSTVRQTNDVFNDALASLFTAISSHFLPGKALPPDASIALAEFLDLIRWASPPETEIHLLAEDVKVNYEQTMASEVEFQKVVQRQSGQNVEYTWSSWCNANGGFTCGLWSLLHILTVGVAERHSYVLGDTQSVSIIRAGQVIRSFIEQSFFGCDSCRDSWIELFDVNCSGMYDIVSSMTGNPEDGKLDDNGWRFLALCIWKMHSDYRHSIDPSALLWPTQTDCPKCWQSFPVDKEILHMNSIDQNELYNHLKKTYWQSGSHNNRLVVLNKLSQAKRALSIRRIRARMAAHSWSNPLLILNIFVACYLVRVFRPRWRSTVLILLCNIFRRGRHFMLNGKSQKRRADQRNSNESSLQLDQSNQACNDSSTCKSPSESRYRQSMRSHNGFLGHNKYATTSRRNFQTM